jgi:hypothetical protein
MENNTIYTMSPDLITTVAQLLQLAILTGTDLYDHLQTLQMVTKGDKLQVSPEFKERMEAEIARLSAQAEALASQQLPLGFKFESIDS